MSYARLSRVGDLGRRSRSISSRFTTLARDAPSWQWIYAPGGEIRSDDPVYLPGPGIPEKVNAGTIPVIVEVPSLCRVRTAVRVEEGRAFAIGQPYTRVHDAFRPKAPEA
jgi:hypothetical protein